ncbi:hypothetical protein GCM10007100_36360 [Roseibacillus persicicus]|uniref:Uncharacterized protein n=2 Tax=Roseibacillus persicicus TaxID=454148 RepID=A0A918WPE9_9BACT|nr:hypothetical protein GCM10007100_36360 [Roseibacillus persicicus]
MALLGAMVALVGLSGCLEMESTISVKKDGSGTLTEKATFGAQMAAMMKMGAGQEGGEDPFADFSEEKLKEKAAQYGEGVEFVSVSKEDKDGGIVITSIYKFSDINKVTYNPNGMMDDEEVVPDEELKMFSFKDGELTVTFPNPAEEDFSFGDDEMGEEEMMMAAPMMAGLKITSKLEFEGGIETTNATYRDGNTVTLMSMNFDELMKNEGGLKVMSNLKKGSREDFAKAVKEIKGFEMESQEKVKVKLK